MFGLQSAKQECYAGQDICKYTFTTLRVTFKHFGTYVKPQGSHKQYHLSF